MEDNYPNDFDIYINKILGRLLQEQRNHFNQNTTTQTIIFDKNINNIDYSETVILSDNNEIPIIINLSTNEEISILSYQFVIGRNDSCHYKVTDNLVSQKHIMLVKEADSWYVIDFNTTNGTFLNDTKLHSGSQVKINNSDIIKIGNTSFIFMQTMRGE